MSGVFVPCSTVSVDFKALLQAAARQFSSQHAFAQALGISPSRLNRALNKGDYPLNALNCLKLASITGEPAGDVLRAAGKADVAELIEQLYGGGRAALTTAERELIATWALIPPDVQRHFDVLLRHARDVAVHAQPGKTGPAPEARRRRRPAATRRTAGRRAEEA